jgi:hypothetical protein
MIKHHHFEVVDRGGAAEWFETENTSYVFSGVLAERPYEIAPGKVASAVFAEVLRRAKRGGGSLPAACWVRVDDTGVVELGKPAVFEAILDHHGFPWFTTITTSPVVDLFT